jgi:hypothetical protein
MNVAVPKFGAIAMMAISLTLAGCASSAAPLPGIAVQSPVDTTLSWFKAINENDMPLAQAHFARADRNQMEWSGLGSFSFYDLRCHLMAQAMTISSVRCTFEMHNRPIDMVNVSYWSVYMQRKPPGPWLITGYGQP